MLVAVVAVSAGLYFSPEATKIIVMALGQVAWTIMNWIVHAPFQFFSWGAQQVNLGLTLKDVTPCAPHMCQVDKDKFGGLLTDLYERQKTAYDCAPVVLTAANANFLTRHLVFLTNSPDVSQKKCYNSHDLNGAERTSCTSTDELPPCIGAMSWPTVEVDMRAILPAVNKDQCQNAGFIGQEGHAVAAAPNPLCDSRRGSTAVEIKGGVSENWETAMRKLLKEWFKDIVWGDVKAEPQAYCRDTSALSLKKAIIKVEDTYCGTFTSRVEANLNKLVKVINKNRGKHPKVLELDVPASNDAIVPVE